MVNWISYNKKFLHLFILILNAYFFIKNKAIAVNKANNSRECPEFARIRLTKAKIIQTINQTKINILNPPNSL